MSSLTQIYKASEPDALHIIFVHGLGGDARSTWMRGPKDNSTLWPVWVGEDVGCHVWVASYGAALSGWTDAAMHLVDLGEAFFAALQAEPGLQNCKIVLVGHSLGGLVIKSGMTQAKSIGDDQREKMLKKIAGVVFVGTPHQGSSLATIADQLRRVLRTNPQVTNMADSDAWLNLLNKQFQRLYLECNFGVRVFLESKGVLIGRRVFGIAFGKRLLIVDRNSGDPEITGVVPTTIEGDHIEIAKPESRASLIHKALIEFINGVGGKLESPASIGESYSVPCLGTVDLLATFRGASASLLTWPSTLADGTWLHRPELDSLIQSLATESSSTHFLLGDPGCGKSSLLVRLAQERLAAEWCVLAIKADRLPPEVLDREALAEYLNLDSDVATVLRRLSKDVPVLVLIDQVDALADLVVQHSARLRVLLDLVQDLSNLEGVHTVISCRTFEQKHDPALRNLDATVIQLDLPEWLSVQSVLTARGLQAEIWNPDIQQVLRSPHALDVFLSLLGGASELDVLGSFHGLLEKQWEVQVLTDTTGRRRSTLHYLAKLMADREVLGLPLAQVEDHYSEIQQLSAAGLLRVDEGSGRRVEFRHQTLYEFVRARSFLEESGSLTETVREQQGSLRIRPQLWHALGYFRSASPEDYSIEIDRLWRAGLRLHLKMLLIEFLGLQIEPLQAERQLVEQAMTDAWFLPRFIGAAVGSPGWFATLLPAHLPRLMALPGDQAQMLLPMLTGALHFSTGSVVELVRRHWLPDKDRDLLSWQVLGSGDVAPQVGCWLDCLVLIVGRTSISEWSIAHLAGVISAALPEEAPRVIAAWLKRQLDAATGQLTTITPDDGAAEGDMSKGIQLALEARQFHDMEAIAEAAPKAFVLALWPLFLEGVQLLASEPPRIVIGYIQSNALLFDDIDDEEARHDRPLLRSVQLGIQGWADSDPDGFLEFVAENSQSELLLVHRLLAVGLVRAAAHSPGHVFEYLVGDPRRFILGPYNNVHKESIALIEAVSPLLDDPAYSCLEASLRDWRYYNDTAREDDPAVRHRRLQWARQHRMRLLRALPVGRRSHALQRLLEEEERAFPALTDEDVHFYGVQCIGSSVSAAQMERAADADVVNLFSELTDDTAWDHPRHRMKGGAIQAGRELAELAKTNLAKVLRIIRELDPTSNETPVSCVLRELVPAGFTAPELYLLVAELEDKGFIGVEFRRDASYAIAKAANKEAPVPSEMIDRLERWLVANAVENSSEIEATTKDDFSSVLWGYGRLRALPNGNYPTLSALTSACLMAEPPRLQQWLSILERHVMRLESPQVWDAMIQTELLYLQMTDHSRAEAFIDQLIVNVPSIVSGQGWAHFVAHAFRWASAEAARRWLMAIVENEGSLAQSAGELACLRHSLFPAEDWSRDLVREFIRDTASAMALGVAHSVANLWHEPMARPIIHPVMLQLLRTSDDHVLIALSGLFLRDGFADDIETRELLDAIADFPNILMNGRAEHLAEILASLVEADSERVCRVVRALLDAVGDQMGNSATSWYLSTEWLLDIALQLQDMGAADRAAGSELFERMLEFNMPQARAMTLDLDKRTPIGNNHRAPVRRRSRTRTRKSARMSRELK